MPENTEFFKLNQRTIGESDSSDGSEIPAQNDFFDVKPRAEDDPIQLRDQVMREVKAQFKERGAPLSAPQRDAISCGTEAVLSAKPGTATVNCTVPGGGKSTLIRALLIVLAKLFLDMAQKITRKLGGVIVVVETTLEGEELERICNQSAGKRVATLIVTANDSNLSRGACLNGTAKSFKDCPRRSCPDYAVCPLMQPLRQVDQTPILIMLQARYALYLEDMSRFETWTEVDGTKHSRSLLLVDELPQIFELNAIDRIALNEAESELEALRASYKWPDGRDKREILFRWNRDVRRPFLKLISLLRSKPGKFKPLMQSDLEESGFDDSQLSDLEMMLEAYSKETKAEHIIFVLRTIRHGFSCVGNTEAVYLPRLKQFDSRLATVVFSGTADFAPEITGNSKIRKLDRTTDESYERLTINVQTADCFNASRTGLQQSSNLKAVVAWVKSILTQERGKHKKILVVTYKSIAKVLWDMLEEFRDVLIPYTDRLGVTHEQLPYFNGMNGSNQYLQATCVICVGLNRNPPGDYLARAIALDDQGAILASMADEIARGVVPTPTKSDQVTEVQELSLAGDIIQLVFRSALRNHGGHHPITLWLLQPPDGVVLHLLEYFPGCHLNEVSELPEACYIAITTGRQYKGVKTHAAILMEFLNAQWTADEITPDEIRAATGLTQQQFKEARKNPTVKQFFEEHVTTIGNGKNTVYRKNHPEQEVA